MTQNYNILIAPLNWGLGHATRCIPIIKALEATGFTPIIASDGSSLELLQKEFPHLVSLELPSYNIDYPENGEDFKWKMIKKIPSLIDAIRAEKKLVKKWISEFEIMGIISDNRLGIVSKKVPSIFITHQLNVLTGNTTWISSRLHRHIINKFTECWVPDFEENPNFTGKLGHLKKPVDKIRYIGPMSRFSKSDVQSKNELLVILSGPEPQRSLLENQLKAELLLFEKSVILIKGIVESQQTVQQYKNITTYNFMNSDQLEQTINESEMVLCRSGYTSIMDLAKLGKKCFFIPTPGQYEQEYLAKRLKKKGIVPFATQSGFTIENLLEVDLYKGLSYVEQPVHWKNLFSLFECK